MSGLCCIGNVMGGPGYCTCKGRKAANQVAALEARVAALEAELRPASGARAWWCPTCRATSENSRLCGACSPPTPVHGYRGSVPAREVSTREEGERG